MRTASNFSIHATTIKIVCCRCFQFLFKQIVRACNYLLFVARARACRLQYSDQSFLAEHEVRLSDHWTLPRLPGVLYLSLVRAKHNHWQHFTRLNYFYSFLLSTRNVGSILRMTGIWCGSIIILNKTDLIWNWICLFQFCFEALGWHKGWVGRRETFVLGQRSVVSLPCWLVSTHMTWCHCPVCGQALNSFLFQLRSSGCERGKVWPTCQHLRSQKPNLSPCRGGEKQKRGLILIKISVSFHFLTGADFK